jgi:hypothetical protein
MGTKVFDNALDLITFSRASGGTSLRKISYGSELVTNGTFDSDTDWTLVQSGISSNVLNIQNSGTYSKATNGDGSLLTVGKVYLLSFDIISVSTAGNFRVRLGGSTTASVSGGAAVGSYSSVLVADLNFSTVQFESTGANTFTGTVDNISVKEVLFDQPDGTLTLFNHPDDIPRIDYNADGTVKGLLIEEQRTNLVTYSETIQDGVGQWDNGTLATASGQTTQDAAVSPDGSMQAVKLYEVNTDSTPKFIFTNPFSASTANITASIFVKAAERNYAAIQCYVNTGDRHTILVDLTNGNIVDTDTTGTPTIVSVGVEDFGEGWYRGHVTLAHTSGTVAIVVGPSDTASPSYVSGGPAYTGVTGNGIYIYGAQLEAGSFPTSYIPTSGSTATRSADIASIPVTDFGYNTVGTIYVDGTFRNGDTIITVGSETIDADADGEKDYAQSYTSDPSASDISFDGGTYKTVRYYPRVLTASQISEMTG